MSDILNSHYTRYKNLIEDVKNKCLGRTVVLIEPISYNMCLESYPCKGHSGAKIHFGNGETLNYSCSSAHQNST